MTSREVIVLVLAVVFGSSVIFTRRLVIAPRVREHTEAEIFELEAQLPSADSVDPDVASAARTARRLLRNARSMIAREPKPSAWQRIKDALMWNGSSDLAAFELIHKAKLAAIEVWSPAQVHAWLTASADHLNELPEAQRRHWKDELGTLASSHDLVSQRAGLEAFLRELYAARDTKFADLNGLQNKTTWLIGIATLAIGGLAIDGFEELLMAGAVGGIISRAHRVLGRRQAPTDYGLSWARVFLAPTVGALAAWAGALVIVTLRDLDVVSLDALFSTADALRDPSYGLLGLAIAFGFSERFLTQVASRAQNSIEEQQSQQTAEDGQTDPVSLVGPSRG